MMQPLRTRNPGAAAGDGIESDRRGRLFDRSAREVIVRLGGKVDAEPLEALAALRLAAGRVHAAMERWAEGHGLSESRLRALFALYYAPGRGCALGELADELHVVPRTITGVADVLERDGLIRRTAAATDRRSVHAVLTEKGAARVESMRRDAVARQAELFAGLTKAQMADLRHLCLLLVRRLDAASGES